ncbi:MAG TPA: single-stranded-DNA-specific exonuclease RecJ [Candidatus Paceibacterota bacterium]|jgi:single-stranded-DNA-specific exonuclease|nr:single-stranded-DNA-specific exonuclease RecJ [Candidatus Paceibacterota bacterium]
MNITIPTPGDLKEMLLERLGLEKEAQQAFLEPEYKLGDPFLFRDMDKAVSRIKKALDNKEHIGIYSDYDCDGIPGAVVLLDFFKVLGALEYVHVYIPDRHDEGYGVNTQGITELQKLGVTLMITVDVGITALAEVADAQSRGIDVIVTDHHAPLEILPASLVIHPQVGEYPEKNLCGAATAFMLVRAFLKRHAADFSVPEGWEKWLLDLVGFATLSDMVALTGENRVLAYYGMMVMKKTRRVGLQALFAANSVDVNNLTESDLTFTVAPRLNAASRMASPLLAFELLSTTDRMRAIELVRELTKINDERKLLVARIVKEAHGRLEARNELPDIVVIGDLSWRPAVLGLVAGKLSETYNRSFFVWGEGGDGSLKGSCRMIVGHHAAHLMNSLPEGVLAHSGGHEMAGGFAVIKEQVHFFEEALNKVLNEGEKDGETEKAAEMPTAFPLPLASATVRHLATVRQFAPFGVANEEPIFSFEDCEIKSTKKFGKAKEHLECVISDPTGTATAFTFFANDDLLEKVQPGHIVSLSGTIESGWRGGVRIRIREIL